MLTSIKMSQRSIDARCAVPSMLHFAVQELKCNGGSGKRKAKLGSSRVQACKAGTLGSLIFDGEQMQLNLQLIFHHSILSSIKV